MIVYLSYRAIVSVSSRAVVGVSRCVVVCVGIVVISVSSLVVWIILIVDIVVRTLRLVNIACLEMNSLADSYCREEYCRCSEED